MALRLSGDEVISQCHSESQQEIAANFSEYQLDIFSMENLLSFVSHLISLYSIHFLFILILSRLLFRLNEARVS
jgi:hypothetical protein